MRRDDVASTLIRRHFRTKCPLGVLRIFGVVTGEARKWTGQYTEKVKECKSDRETEL